MITITASTGEIQIRYHIVVASPGQGPPTCCRALPRSCRLRNPRALVLSSAAGPRVRQAHALVALRVGADLAAGAGVGVRARGCRVNARSSRRPALAPRGLDALQLTPSWSSSSKSRPLVPRSVVALEPPQPVLPQQPGRRGVETTRKSRPDFRKLKKNFLTCLNGERHG